MGGRSGKFIVPRVEEKTEDSPREADTFEQVKAPDNEQSVQLLNGVVTAGPDVPCIDEVLEVCLTFSLQFSTLRGLNVILSVAKCYYG
uniref:Uncharacterized protein n=1 Tax=Schistosoma japonicum TaxID=6182 RepID=C1LN08_SCHJA|nr:hypothetical protein [Schistosoma japonicum]